MDIFYSILREISEFSKLIDIFVCLGIYNKKCKKFKNLKINEVLC